MVPGFNRLEGIMRTVYNQYDSLVRPLQKWLDEQGVRFELNTRVHKLGFLEEANGKRVDRIVYEHGGHAGEIVVIFGIVLEEETIADCSRKMDATIKQFSDELKTLGIGRDDVFVDLVAQNKTCGFEVTGAVAWEKLVGFELKQNVSIRYKEKPLLEKPVVAASRSQIFDLIKVDYIVTDTRRIDDRLMEEASHIIKNKASRYEKLLDIKLQPPAQVYAERPAMYSPTGMSDSYTAFETEQIGAPVNRERLTTQSARASRTFFFNALDASGFDLVINPTVIEPVVQFTLCLKVKYEVAPIRAKSKALGRVTGATSSAETSSPTLESIELENRRDTDRKLWQQRRHREFPTPVYASFFKSVPAEAEEGACLRSHTGTRSAAMMRVVK